MEPRPDAPMHGNSADAPEPLADIDLGTDIGLGSAPVAQRPTSHRDGTSTRHRGRLIGAAIAAVVAIVAAIVFAGSDADIAEDPPAEITPTPAPTAAEPPPTPQPVVVIDNDGLTRAGQDCALSDGARTVATVRIPTEFAALECRFVGDPLLVRESGASSPIDLVITDVSVGTLLTSLAVDPDVSDVGIEWSPTSRYATWLVSLDAPLDDDSGARGPEQVHVVDLGDERLVVAARDHFDVASSIVDSTRAVAETAGFPTAVTALPTPGGDCRSDRWAMRVPPDWFAADDCAWVSPLHRPGSRANISVATTAESLDDFVGNTPWTVTSDESSVTTSGLAQRSITGTEGVGTLPVRVVLIDLGDERVVITARLWSFGGHPHIDWDDVANAQDQMLASFRVHSGPQCGDEPPQRWRIGSGDRAMISVDGEQRQLVGGTALVGTGCRRSGADGAPQLEVTVEVSPHLVGWARLADVTPVDVAPCPSGQGVFNPRDWDESTEGDFDGDGRLDRAYVRRLQADLHAAGVLENVAVLYADGGFAEAAIAGPSAAGEDAHAPTAAASISGRLGVVRIAGAARDLLLVETAGPQAALIATLLVDLSACTPELRSTLLDGTDGQAEFGWCLGPFADAQILRSWQRSPDPFQRFVSDRDEVWSTDRGTIVASDITWVDPPCGPRVPAKANPILPLGPGTEISGTHELSVPWLGQGPDALGSVTFQPVGGETYLVEGAQVNFDGDQLRVSGILARSLGDELRLDGRVETLVHGQFGGETCIRDGQHRFERRGADTYVLTDPLNCDGQSLDRVRIRLLDQ